MRTDSGCHPRVGKATGVRKIVLVGNHNVGKSVLFACLTGRYVTVSNYPGTTVEVAYGKVHLKGQEYDLLDTPGIESVFAGSEDERMVQDVLLSEGIACLVQVADAKNLKRALSLTLQLSEFRHPIVLVLNMLDEADARGYKVNCLRLSRRLGIPVVTTVAVRNQGIGELKVAIQRATCLQWTVFHPPAITQAVQTLKADLNEGDGMTPGRALLYLTGDAHPPVQLEDSPPALVGAGKISVVRKDLENILQEPVESVLSLAYRTAVEEILEGITERTGSVSGNTFFIRLGQWMVHPLLGYPFLLLILWILYEFVGVFGAGILVDFIENTLFGRYINPFAIRWVQTILPWKFGVDLLVGGYGLLTMALTYSLAIIFPIVLTFFIFFSLLEDSGYLPRLAVLVNNLFRRIGLTGKAVLPMVLGLGCDTMATMTARILETPKERVIVTLLLALGVPCSAQLGVVLAMLASLSWKATLIWGGVVALVMLLVGYLSSLILKGESARLVIEIPPLRIPRLSNIFWKTLARVEWYLTEVVPLFLLGTFLLFLLDRLRVLPLLEKVAEPLITGLLNLPAEASSAFLLGFLRRDYGAAGLYSLARDGKIDSIGIVVSMVTITLFIPCVANLLMMVKERGWKTALAMSAFIFPFAFLVGGILNALLRAWGMEL